MFHNQMDSKPAVVFVDEGPWESFFHLASMLRGTGIRTVRVSVGRSKWQAGNILFDRSVHFAAVPSPERLAEALSNEKILDVQSVENLAAATYAALDLLSDRRPLKTWSGRFQFTDKMIAAEQLRELDLQTPDALTTASTSAVEAVKQYSLPILLKRRIGSSGSGVEMFNSLESLEEFLAQTEDTNEWFFERFTRGQPLVCAVCANEGHIEVVATYEIVKRVFVRGPSSVVEFLIDPQLVSSAEKLAAELNISGLMCFDVVRDIEGVDWIHDLNLRAFGGLSTCQLAGFDFRGSYIRCLLGRGTIAPVSFDGERLMQYAFPGGRRDLAHSAPRKTAWIRTAKWLWRAWRLLGARYFLYFAITTPSSSFRVRHERLRDEARSQQY